MSRRSHRVKHQRVMERRYQRVGPRPVNRLVNFDVMLEDLRRNLIMKPGENHK